jgi:putative oxidoreductase
MVGLRKTAVWAGVIVLAVAFIAVGVSKLQGASAERWAERFQHWGYPAHTHAVVGVLELLGGIGLLIPRWRRAASLTLVAVMIGALGTHLVHSEFPRVVPPLILGGLAVLIGRTKN